MRLVSYQSHEGPAWGVLLPAGVVPSARLGPDADVRDAVFGYACFNDGSLRDFQRKTSQWTIGKNFDATGAFGPCLVGADELPRTASDCTSRRA